MHNVIQDVVIRTIWTSWYDAENMQAQAFAPANKHPTDFEII